MIRRPLKSALLPLALLLGLGSAHAARAQGELEGDAGANWPREIDAVDSRIVIYQPQVESLQGNRMTARAAVSVSKGDSESPVFGAFWFECRLLTDRDRRTATPVDLKVTDVRFPQAARPDAESLRTLLAGEVPKWQFTLSMDHLLSELKIFEEQKAAAQGLRNDPPKILYRTTPSVLVRIEGAPAWRELPGTRYRRIANSAFFIVQETGSGACYLHVPPFWWTSAAPAGPWRPLESPPAAAVAAWKSEAPPGFADSNAAAARPEVVVAEEPTELLCTDGPAQYVAIPGTDLLYAKNTDGDLFLEIRSQDYFVLLSGRWYRRPAGRDGSWNFVPPDQLPIDFARIPASGPKGHVLACVAGTPEAREAVLDAEIPQTAAIAPGEAPDLDVSYDGDPSFVPVEGTAVEYAANTPFSVFLVGGRYFCCHDGIWFESGIARGPWFVCVRVPAAIYLIPPSCPHYYCTYCHVFASTPDVVYVGYYPGYRGCYVAGRTVVYGTGWHYAAWHGRTWIPRPVTWGVQVRYDRYACDWRTRPGLGGPAAWAGLGTLSSHPAYTVPVGVGGWWSGVGYPHNRVDVHRNLEFAARAPQGAPVNVYARHPKRLATPRPLPAERARPVAPERQTPNNVYTDRQGNPYRRAPEGGWEHRTPQGWQRETPGPTPHARQELPPVEPHRRELEQRHQSRNEGNERAKNWREHAPPPQPPPKPPPPPPPPHNPREHR